MSLMIKILNKFIKEEEKNISAQAIVRDDVWKKYKSKIGKGFTWYVITPANFDYCKDIFNLKMNKDEFKHMLMKKVKVLKENNEEIQLLIHLSKVKKFLVNNLQVNKFNEAIKFMDSLAIKPTKFIPIDGVYDGNTLSIAKKEGLIELISLDIFIIRPILKILKLLGIKISFVQKIYQFFRKADFLSIFFIIMGEFMNIKEKTIHIEALVRDDIWYCLKRCLIGKGYTWFIITPVNYEYCKAYFNIQMDKDEFANILKERILYLKEAKEEIQLHIHLSIERTFLDNEIQKKKITNAIKFMNYLGIKPTKFAAGWWSYNNYTLTLLQKFGIKEIHDYSINPFLKMRKFQNIKLKYVHKYWHDFDFI